MLFVFEKAPLEISTCRTLMRGMSTNAQVNGGRIRVPTVFWSCSFFEAKYVQYSSKELHDFRNKDDEGRGRMRMSAFQETSAVPSTVRVDEFKMDVDSLDCPKFPIHSDSLSFRSASSTLS